MSLKPISVAGATALFLLVAAHLAPVCAADPIAVLIVDGQNNHDWALTTHATRAILVATGRFRVDVTTTPKKNSPDADWAAWRPRFAEYDLVLSNYNGERWPGRVEKAFTDFVRQGNGVVIVHAANNAFKGWDDYNQMIGLGWRGADFGRGVTIDDATGKPRYASKGEGRGAGHGRQHAFVVTVRTPDHPIMRGLPATQWMHAKDELYHGQRGPAEDMTILSSAFSAEETKGTGVHEPITWVIPFGQGKVVTTVMGHHWRGQEDFDALHCVGFQTILARSAEWAATGKVTLPLPAEFPGPRAPSVVEPHKVSWKNGKLR